jgi:hypothetical protein
MKNNKMAIRMDAKDKSLDEIAIMLWLMLQKGFNNVTTSYKNIELDTTDLKNAKTKEEAINNLSDTYVYKLAYDLVKTAHQNEEKAKQIKR